MDILTMLFPVYPSWGLYNRAAAFLNETLLLEILKNPASERFLAESAIENFSGSVSGYSYTLVGLILYTLMILFITARDDVFDVKSRKPCEV